MIHLIYDPFDPLAASLESMLLSLGMKMRHTVLPACETRLPADTVEEICNGTTLFLADIHHCAAEALLQLSTRAFSLVRRLQPLPAVATRCQGLYVFSRFARERLIRWQPQLHRQLRLCRMPFAPGIIQKSGQNEQPGLDVLFIGASQLLELLLAEKLTDSNLRVAFLWSESQMISHNDQQAYLFSQVRERGLEVYHCLAPADFYAVLSATKTLMAADWTRCPSFCFAASAAGATVVAPNFAAYAELLPPYALYRPFNLDEAVALACEASKLTTPDWVRHQPQVVADDYLALTRDD